MSLRTFLLLTAALGGAMLSSSCSPARPASPTATSPATPLPATPNASLGCSAVGAAPTPSGSSLLPPVTAADYTRGPDSAAVTLLFYCDFQSAQCEIFNRVLDQLIKDHPNGLRVVIRPVPIPISVVPALDKSEISADA